jgi:hypothetical protein
MQELIRLNEILDDLIDVTHNTYLEIKETDIENRTRLDEKIKTYWYIKNLVEDMLIVKN